MHLSLLNDKRQGQSNKALWPRSHVYSDRARETAEEEKVHSNWFLFVVLNNATSACSRRNVCVKIEHFCAIGHTAPTLPLFSSSSSSLLLLLLFFFSFSLATAWCHTYTLDRKEKERERESENESVRTIGMETFLSSRAQQHKRRCREEAHCVWAVVRFLFIRSSSSSSSPLSL